MYAGEADVARQAMPSIDGLPRAVSAHSCPARSASVFAVAYSSALAHVCPVCICAISKVLVGARLYTSALPAAVAPGPSKDPIA